MSLGRAFLANEVEGCAALHAMGADYALVTFGGMMGASDDLSRARGIARIAQVSPDSLHNGTLLYKMSYARFGQVKLEGYRGYDRRREAKISPEPLLLHQLEEVFTSEHWLVRIFRIPPPADP